MLDPALVPVQFDHAAQRLGLPPTGLLNIVATGRLEALVPLGVLPSCHWSDGQGGRLRHDAADEANAIPGALAAGLAKVGDLVAICPEEAPKLRGLGGTEPVRIRMLQLPAVVATRPISLPAQCYAHLFRPSEAFEIRRHLLWLWEHDVRQLELDRHSPVPAIGAEVGAVRDLSHESAAPELIAAIAAWEAVFVRGEGPAKGSPKSRVRAWLDATYASEFKPATRDRIAMVANPNKIGGAPPVVTGPLKRKPLAQ
jgi:hypothetical protein